MSLLAFVLTDSIPVSPLSFEAHSGPRRINSPFADFSTNQNSFLVAA
jgi:hypothetical protein